MQALTQHMPCILHAYSDAVLAIATPAKRSNPCTQSLACVQAATVCISCIPQDLTVALQVWLL